MNLEKLQDKISYQFQDPILLKTALTHRSFVNEHREELQNNERFEFLGDAILEFWSSQKIFSLFPGFREGELTNLRSLLVCTQNLAEISRQFSLGDYLLLSRGEASHGGRDNQSLLADTLESLIGAIYLDGGLNQAVDFMDKFFTKSLTDLSQKKVYKDPKSLFQEISQAKSGLTPNYQTLSQTGPDHHKNFEVGVYIGDKLIATGTGNSKQKAEEDAATKAAALIV